MCKNPRQDLAFRKKRFASDKKPSFVKPVTQLAPTSRLKEMIMQSETLRTDDNKIPRNRRASMNTSNLDKSPTHLRTHSAPETTMLDTDRMCFPVFSIANLY